MLNQTEINNLLHEFFEARGMYPNKESLKESHILGKILACGLCGISVPEQNNWVYSKVSLKELESITKLSDNEKQSYMHKINIVLTLPIDNCNNTKVFRPFKCKSVYQSKVDSSIFHHLHPELVYLSKDNLSEYM